MKLVLLGGAGAMSRAAVRDLVKTKEVSKIVIADINKENAARLVDELRSKKISTIQVDVNDRDRLIESMKGADAVLDGTPHDMSITVAKGMIDAKVNGCCIGYRSDTALEILKMDGLAKAAGITYLLSVGATPGASGIFAKYLADEMDEADSVTVYDTTLRPIAMSPSLLDTFLTEITEPKIIYENGALKKVPPFSGMEEVEYPEPFPPGKYVVYYALHSEPVTVPTAINGIKNVCVRMGWYRDYMESLSNWYDLGLFNKEPIKVKNREIIPRDVLAELLIRRPVPKDRETIYLVVKVSVTGRRNGKNVEGNIFVHNLPTKNQEESPLAIGTGYPASIILQILGRSVKEKGVLASEACINPQEYMREIRKRPGHVIQEYWR